MPLPKDWEKEFDKKFELITMVGEGEAQGTFALEEDRNKVKSFIRSLLASRDVDNQDHIAHKDKMVLPELPKELETKEVGIVGIGVPIRQFPSSEKLSETINALIRYLQARDNQKK